MSFYEDFINSLKDKFSNNHLNNENVSGAIAAELILISSVLLSALLLRHISVIFTAIIILILIVLIFTNLPISIKLFSEQDDSMDKMMFYCIIALGIIVSVIYWGGI